MCVCVCVCWGGGGGGGIFVCVSVFCYSVWFWYLLLFYCCFLLLFLLLLFCLVGFVSFFFFFFFFFGGGGGHFLLKENIFRCWHKKNRAGWVWGLLCFFFVVVFLFCFLLLFPHLYLAFRSTKLKHLQLRLLPVPLMPNDCTIIPTCNAQAVILLYFLIHLCENLHPVGSLGQSCLSLLGP